MRVFHFSDIHWHDGNRDQIKTLIKATLEDLAQFSEDTETKDATLIFSGDLVLAGERQEDFEAAYSDTIAKIADFLKIDSNHIVLCPGNHDMSRASVRNQKMLEAAAKISLIDRDSISNFVGGIDGDFEKELLLERTENFYHWYDQKFDGDDLRNRFFRTKSVTVDGLNIGFAIMNSAFRTVGEGEDSDNGFLIIGEDNIDNALGRLDKCEIKFLVTHHPLPLLQAADQAAVKTKLDKDFTAHFFGHMHEADPVVQNRPLGSVVSAQCGSLFAHREWFNGYQVIDFDFVEGSATFQIREFQPKSGRFGAAESIAASGFVKYSFPIGDDRDSSIARVLRDLRETVKRKALAHVDFADLSQNQCEAILEARALPTIFRTSLEDDPENTSIREKREFSNSTEIVDRQRNVFLIGPPQSGRTALAHDIAIKFTEAPSGKTRIPIILSKADLFKRFFEIRQAIIRYAELSVAHIEIERLVREGGFAFIVDDMTFANSEELERFESFISNYGENIWIALGHRSAEGVAAEAQLRKSLPNFDIYEIQGVPRKAIRRLSEALADSKDEADRKFDVVMGQIKAEGMPRSPYIAMLLIWANRQLSSGEKLNEALLLQNVLEHLLGRADFRSAKRGELGAVGKEIILSHIAIYLTDVSPAISENDLLKMLAIYFEDTRLPFFANDVLEKLIVCGILSRFDDQISFKYDTFRKYFYALAMRDDKELFDRNLQGLNFITYKGELELFSGLKLKNDELIDKIMSVLEKRDAERLASVDTRKLIDPVDLGFVTSGSKKRLSDIKNKRLSQSHVDDMLDRLDERAERRGEVSPKDIVGSDEKEVRENIARKKQLKLDSDMESETNPLSLNTYMTALKLLARVTRNSDFSSFDKKGPAAGMVIEGYNKIYLSLMEDLGAILSEVIDEDDDFSADDSKFLRYAMGKLVFQILGHICVGVLSTPALGDTITGVLAESADRPGVRLISLFLLEDANADGWADAWSKLIADKGITRFEVENLIERLYEAVSLKALDANQSERFKKVGEELERRFDWSEAQYDRFKKSIEKTKNLKALTERTGKGD